VARADRFELRVAADYVLDFFNRADFDLLALQELRTKYKDTTGAPVKLWPTRSYD